MGFTHAARRREQNPPFHFVGVKMDPRDFLTLASQLASGKNPSAADLRTAVSHAYYTVFNVAIDLLKKMRIKPPGGRPQDWGEQNGRTPQTVGKR